MFQELCFKNSEFHVNYFTIFSLITTLSTEQRFRYYHKLQHENS